MLADEGVSPGRVGAVLPTDSRPDRVLQREPRQDQGADWRSYSHAHGDPGIHAYSHPNASVRTNANTYAHPNVDPVRDHRGGLAPVHSGRLHNRGVHPSAPDVHIQSPQRLSEAVPAVNDKISQAIEGHEVGAFLLGFCVGTVATVTVALVIAIFV